MRHQASDCLRVSLLPRSHLTCIAVGLVGFCLCALAWPTPSNGQPAREIAVEPDPLVRIGTVDGPGEFIFQLLVDAAVLPDGRLLTADRGTGNLRNYTRDGEFVRSFGGEGEGPREFRFIEGVTVHDDTVIVVDPMLGKYADFSVQGEFIGTGQPPRSRASLIGIEEEGRRWWRWGSLSVSGPANDVTVDSVSVGYSDGPESDIERVSGAIALWRYGGQPYPFSPMTEPTLLRDSLLIPEPVGGELAVVGPAGGRTRVIRVPLPETDTEEAWRVLEREIQVRDDLQQFRGQEIPPVDELPRMGAVLVDGADRIWVKEYDPAEDAQWLGGWAGGGSSSIPKGRSSVASTCPPISCRCSSDGVCCWAATAMSWASSTCPSIE